jgi:hypothetical protein
MLRTKARLLRVPAQQARADRPEGAPVLHHHGQDRAELDDDVEHLPLIGIVAEDLGRKDQVPGRRDRDEFGEPLDDAEQDGG